MLSTAGVLVVPPFECAWLTGEEFVLKEGRGCLSFEVKGEWGRQGGGQGRGRHLAPPVC